MRTFKKVVKFFEVKVTNQMGTKTVNVFVTGESKIRKELTEMLGTTNFLVTSQVAKEEKYELAYDQFVSIATKITEEKENKNGK